MGSIQFIFALFLTFTVTYASPIVVHEKRDVPLNHALNRRRIERDAHLPMRVGLKPNQRSTALAEGWLTAVSHPNSPDYARYWTQEEVIEAFQPTDDTVNEVLNWLSSHGIHGTTHTDNKQWIAFDLPAAKAEELLNTEFHEHHDTNGAFQASCDHYSLPEHLQAHIDYITPGVKPSHITGRTERSRIFHRDLAYQISARREVQVEAKSNTTHHHPPFPLNDTSLATCYRYLTPHCIRALYHFDVPDPNEHVCPNNTLGVFETESLYYQGDLDKLFEHYTDIPKGTSPIFKSIDGGERPPNGTHEFGWKYVDGEANLDLSMAMPIIYPQNVTVFQTDDRYWSNHLRPHKVGLFNTFLDAIDGSYCTYCAYGECGDSKLDPVYPDPHKGGYKGKLQCGVYKPTNVMSISYNFQEKDYPYSYQRRQCDEYLKLALQGTTIFLSSGDEGVGPFEGHGRVFVPGQALGCPWVTSVGATEIPPHGTVNETEQAVDWRHAHFASGGGFSLIFDRPKYQENAVSAYFNVSDPPYKYFTNGTWRNSTGRYNRNGRGVPDVSANGAHTVFYNQNKHVAEGGTSASCPIVASLFNRIVEERVRAGKGPLGHVNPVLYQHPEVFNDIVKGHNRYENTRGFDCAPGWDPVTGLGTPNYPKLLNLFLSLP